MKLNDIEDKFLSELESLLEMKMSAGRNEHGMFMVTADSPCEKIGDLTAYIAEVEITLVCKISHKHIELITYIRLGEPDPIGAMIEEAVKSFGVFYRETRMFHKQ